jgi:CRP/FNR family transcriptional regulator, dissimilatory nitrate respiration regulator
MDYDLLVKSPLFKGLEIQEIKDLLEHQPYRLKNYKAGKLISQSGELVERLLLVTRGIVKGEMVDYSGKVIKIEDIPAPGALASAFMFGNMNRFPVNVITVTDTELLVIEKPDFLKLMMSNDKILINFLDVISNRSQFLSEKIKFLSFKTIKSKLAQYFLDMAGENRTEINITRTQNDLADFFGVARPSIARSISELEEDGYIIANGKNIKIINRKGLADLTTD